MIRNIVFDLGNVLVDYDPVKYMRSFGYDDQTVETLMHLIHDREWQLYDRGDYPSFVDLCNVLCRKHPDYRDAFQRILQPTWVRIHTVNEDTAAYLSALKTRGYRIYLLSNLSKESYELIKLYPFFKLIDGGVFSFQEHICKPEDAIYQTLISRYDLVPSETVFLDDSACNIEAAQKNGLHGIVFSTMEEVKPQLEELLHHEMNLT